MAQKIITDKAGLVEDLGRLAAETRNQAGYARLAREKQHGIAVAEGIDRAARMVRDWQVPGIDADALATVLGGLALSSYGTPVDNYLVLARQVIEGLEALAGVKRGPAAAQ